MKKGSFIGKMSVLGAILLLLNVIGTQGVTASEAYKAYDVAGSTEASGTPEPAMPAFIDDSFYNKYPYIRFVSEGDSAQMSDETFYAVAARIGFAINQTEPALNDRTIKELKDIVLPRINEDSLELAYMVVRGAASPDGLYQKNKILGEGRAQWLFDFIRQQLRFPVNEKKFRLDSEAEDYRSLALLMRKAGDKDYALVKQLCDSLLPADVLELKMTLWRAQDGQLWKRLKRQYFPYLRTARIVLYFKKYEGEDVDVAKIDQPIQLVEQPKQEIAEPVMPVIEPVLPVIEPPVEPAVEPEPPAEPEPLVLLPRRELLAIKTNLLFYGAYIPGYDRWCPIPNVAVEYYPLKGHFTFGASFDMPWWQDYNAHKYFQVRQYQLETRYYLKGANRANRANEANGANEAHEANKPLYSGFFLQAYLNAGVFGICFDADRGWVGEGIGGGVGAGYVMPLSRNGHWRLELGLQAGFFRCKYDPYQYENPVDPTYVDHLYYYKWTLDPDLFKKRQYRWNWVGPTRVGITLSYDLLYRKRTQRQNRWTLETTQQAQLPQTAQQTQTAQFTQQTQRPQQAQQPQSTTNQERRPAE